MDSDINSFSVLPITKAKELIISDCEYTDRPALFPVYFQLQCLLQIFRTCLQQPSCRSFTLRQQYDIVCVADARHSTSVELPVEFIQIHVCQQGGQVSSL